MPHLDDADLEHLADLARLDLSGVDRAALRADLETVLDYVDRLAAVDDPSVAPLRHPTHDATLPTPDDLRADVARATTGALPAALERRGGRVVVPRTLDADG
jgi:aspartyl-tRNA(Asn)/glutamyl-tRNA(Gln) amidotransferase subunit C